MKPLPAPHEAADDATLVDDVRRGDARAFALLMRRKVPCFMDEATRASLLRRFDYIFEGQGGYPAICEALPIPSHGQGWAVDGPSGEIPVVTFDQEHGSIRSVGYRFGPVAYSPDVSALDEAAIAALAGVKVWIVDALRWTPHPTHANVDQALAWIARVKPELGGRVGSRTDFTAYWITAWVASKTMLTPPRTWGSVPLKSNFRPSPATVIATLILNGPASTPSSSRTSSKA